MIEAGTYRARCTGEHDVQFGYSSSGNEQVAVLFDILDERGSPTGQRVTWFGSFASDAAKRITFKALDNCGWQTDNLTDLRGIDSQDVELVIGYEEDQRGEQRMRVKWVNRPGEGGRVAMKSQMSQAQREAFAARLRGEIVAHRRGANAPGSRPAEPRPAQRQAAAPYRQNDDLPF